MNGQQDKVKQTIKNTNLSQKYRNERTAKQGLEKEIIKLNATIKLQSDENGALLSELNELNEEIRLRKEEESLIICKNKNGAITHITHTPSFNERISVQELQGINLLTVCKSLLYAKKPFLYEVGNEIKINKKVFNEYLILGGNYERN